MTQKQQMVKSYSGLFKNGATKKFAKDAEKLAQEGWLIKSQSRSDTSRVGDHCITVVYEK